MLLFRYIYYKFFYFYADDNKSLKKKNKKHFYIHEQINNSLGNGSPFFTVVIR